MVSGDSIQAGFAPGEIDAAIPSRSGLIYDETRYAHVADDRHRNISDQREGLAAGCVDLYDFNRTFARVSAPRPRDAGASRRVIVAAPGRPHGIAAPRPFGLRFPKASFNGGYPTAMRGVQFARYGH